MHAREALWPALQTGLAEVMAGFGAVEGEELGSLPGLDDISMAVLVADATSDHAVDIVLWDAGGIERLLGVLHAIGAARLIAGRLITPQAAMRVRVDAEPDQPTALEALVDRLRSAEARLQEQAVVHVVTAPAPMLSAWLDSTCSALALAGCLVDGVILNQVPPAEGGWPEPWATDRRAWAEEVPCATLQVPLMNQRAAEVIGEMRRVLSGVIPRQQPRQVACVPSKPSTLGPDGKSMEGKSMDGTSMDLEMRICLPGINSRDVRVGRRDELLVLTLMGRSRTIPLPAVAARCTVASARMEGSHLVIGLTPDPRVWPGRDHG